MTRKTKWNVKWQNEKYLAEFLKRQENHKICLLKTIRVREYKGRDTNFLSLPEIHIEKKNDNIFKETHFSELIYMNHNIQKAWTEHIKIIKQYSLKNIFLKILNVLKMSKCLQKIFRKFSMLPIIEWS